MISWKRTLRTSHSERFLALKHGKDAAAIDLHYLANGTVAGTATILRGQGLDESEVNQLLRSFDEAFLPDADLESGSLVYTVILGDVLGTFEAIPESTQP
jgi:hypothetical protein